MLKSFEKDKFSKEATTRESLKAHVLSNRLKWSIKKRMSTKKEQRALKRPDLFQKLAKEQLEKIKDNPIPFVAVIGIVLLAASGYFAKQYYDNTQIEKRASALYAIDKIYDDEDRSFSEESGKLSSELSNLNEKVIKLEEKKDLTPEQKSELEKLKAKTNSIQAKQGKLQANHTVSDEAYVAFFNKHSGTAEGTRAAIQVVNSLLQQKSYQKASELAGKVLEKLSPSSLFYGNIAKLYINILSELGQIDPALSETEKLFAKVSETEQPEVLLLKGILLLQKEDRESAKKTFDTVATHFHATDEHKSQAKAYKALIL